MASDVSVVGGKQTSSGLTIAVPDGVQNGDLLVIVAQNSTAASLTPPAGFSTFAGSTNPMNLSGGRGYLFGKTASSEPSSYTCTGSAASILMVCFRGAGGTPTVDANVATAGSTSVSGIDAPSVNAVDDNALLVNIYGCAQSPARSITAPAGQSVAAYVENTRSLMAAVEELNGSGSTGTRHATYSANVLGWMAMSFTLTAPPAAAQNGSFFF